MRKESHVAITTNDVNVITLLNIIMQLKVKQKNYTYTRMVHEIVILYMFPFLGTFNIYSRV